MAIEIPNFNTTILVAPLDWGLGHATRCIPIIRELLQKRCRVVIAATGFHQILLKNEFPDLLHIKLDGYGIRYGKNWMMLRLLFQLPQFFKTIKKEHQWLQKIIEEHKIDAVISDNRYGLHHKQLPCVFITHQLQPKLPPVAAWLEPFVRNRLYKHINQFTQCWVPDVAATADNLAGLLSHPAVMPTTQVKYIGWLSRFEPAPVHQPKTYVLCLCLSGPEPQRTLLENLLVSQLTALQGNVLLIRGLPGQQDVPKVGAHVTVHNHLSAAELQTALQQSEFVLSRCGYSTLMDMQVLGCKCIYVPTPGQTEQEYLGEAIQQKQKALVKKQAGFNLLQTMKEACNFEYSAPQQPPTSLIANALADWLQKVERGK